MALYWVGYGYQIGVEDKLTNIEKLSINVSLYFMNLSDLSLTFYQYFDFKETEKRLKSSCTVPYSLLSNQNHLNQKCLLSVWPWVKNRYLNHYEAWLGLQPLVMLSLYTDKMEMISHLLIFVSIRDIFSITHAKDRLMVSFLFL